jgi:hypothetical protein
MIAVDDRYSGSARTRSLSLHLSQGTAELSLGKQVRLHQHAVLYLEGGMPSDQQAPLAYTHGMDSRPDNAGPLNGVDIRPRLLTAQQWMALVRTIEQ